MSLKQKLFTSFLVLAFLPTALLLFFSYRLATSGADLLVARGVSQTLSAADSLAVRMTAGEQHRLHDDSRRLLSTLVAGIRQAVEVDSQFAFAMLVYPRGDTIVQGNIPEEFATALSGVVISAARESSGRLVVADRLLIWDAIKADTIVLMCGRYLPGDYFTLASEVMDGKARYLSLSKSLLPGGKNLLFKITIALIIVSLIVSLLMAQSLSFGFSAPLERLVDATRRVSHGDLKYRIPEGGGDEVGILIDNFNAMTESLESVTRNLIVAEKEMTWRENARTVAHEIKNLLTPVNVALYQIKQRLLTDQAVDSRLNSDVDALTVEIDAIADLARQFALFAHPTRLAPINIDLKAMINQVIALYAGMAGGRQITGSVKPAGVVVNADPDLLRRVLSNLIKNAIEATRDNGTITVSAMKQQLDCLLEVVDNGRGADETLDLTQPYLTTKKTGTGLGLAIVKKVCDAHGWTLNYGNVNPGFSVRILMPGKR